MTDKHYTVKFGPDTSGDFEIIAPDGTKLDVGKMALRRASITADSETCKLQIHLETTRPHVEVKAYLAQFEVTTADDGDAD